MRFIYIVYNVRLISVKTEFIKFIVSCTVFIKYMRKTDDLNEIIHICYEIIVLKI